MELTLNPALQAYVDPLTPAELEALERSLLAEGCRDALVLWGEVLVDGHNRYALCRKHGLPFQTVQNPRFQSLQDVQLWLIDQNLARRSLSDFQRGELALRKRDLLAERQVRPAPEAAPLAEAEDGLPPAHPSPEVPAAPQERLVTREAVAQVARLSSNQVVQIEKIQKQGAPELVQAVKAGLVSLNAAAAVASLPVPEQAAAAEAGAEELKQAAKRVREAKRKTGPSLATPAELRQQVAELQLENQRLREQLQALGQAV
ncbi:hypothetical protein HNQ51_002176 [Inhella inkyongensis]|uniref:Plasmid replication/partition related protein n=1 Tax=Inhella inkyongensis TaxID=392593 RepID=A0A840S5K8_9BURK|nr:plasmid replication/partition related protein [Inhella inkyongensis]MBB5204862.1 hypothetical protein [Inhella inkyongensis]